MKYCACPKPLASVDPRKAGSCLRCARVMDPAWVSSGATMAVFFNRLAEAVVADTRTENAVGPMGEAVPNDAFQLFRLECETREEAGREKFGFAYLDRDNNREGREENADGAMYAFLDSLQEVRRSGDDNDLDLVLQIAYHDFKAYEARLWLRRKRRGGF